MSLNLTVRKVFLYLFAIIGLVLVIIGGVSLVDLGLRTYVFTKADSSYCAYSIAPVEKTGTEPTAEQQAAEKARCEEQRVADKQRQASTAIAQIIIGLPLYLYHWNRIRKENQV
ncbi:MAG: hypothetical protein ACM3NH_02315 [Candidatus Saccharibacteria bacterium]